MQDNISRSAKGVLRGLHYQYAKPQGKLVSVLMGEDFDVAVDLRIKSPTFGHWVGTCLSADNKRQFWVPKGFAHGFVVLSQEALFTYKCTDYYDPLHEISIRYDDVALNIDWPHLTCAIQLSEKDRQGLEFSSLRDSMLSQVEV